jgi:ubiquitin C-terminal hydrolase
MSVENKFHCGNCAKGVLGKKKIELESLPPCLVFQLKRFALTDAKYTDSVTFPLLLDSGLFSVVFECAV